MTQALLSAQEIWNRVYDAAAGKIRTAATSSAPNQRSDYSAQEVLNGVFDATLNRLRLE